jgi:ribosomal-protein-alanine N-acetyltransferase
VSATRPTGTPDTPSARTPDPSEAEALAAWLAAAMAHPWSAAALAEELERSASGGPRAGGLRVWELDGAVCGLGVWQAVADEGELLLIAVAPERRRGGLGRRLLSALEAEARAAGARVMHLEVRVDNAAARALYAAAGWGEVGRRRAYYPDGTDAVLMSRALTD